MKKLIVFLFLLCHVWNAYSQGSGSILHDIKLPDSFNNRVITLAENDNAGLLWLVANGGLYRYDGNEIIHFNRESDPALPHNSITAIFSDRQNNLWIGTNDGLIRFDLSAWTTTPVRVKSAEPSQSPNAEPPQAPNADPSQAPNLAFSSISQGVDGSIYAGTRDGRLYRAAGDSLELLLNIQQDFPNRYHEPVILSIHEPYPGEIWLNASINQLVRIKVSNGIFAPAEYFGLEPEFGEDVVDELCVHPSGKFLITVSEHGIYTFDARNGSVEKVDLKKGKVPENGRIFFAEMLNRNEVMLITNHPSVGKDKLFVYNFLTGAASEQTLHYPDYMLDNGIEWVQNTGSSLLLSMDSRIMEMVPSNGIFKSFLEDATALNSIRSIYKHPGGPLYASSYKYGFVRVNETTGKKENLSPEYVYSILPWNADTLLLATEGRGLLWYEQGKNRFSPFVPRPAAEGVRRLGVYLTILARGKGHSILVGGYEGLTLVDPYANTSRNVREDQLERLKILSLLKAGEKRIIGTSHGIMEWDSRTDSLRTFLRNTPESTGPYPVYCLARVNQQIWMGTRGDGILVTDLDGHIIDTIDNARGLSNNIVYSLLSEGPYVIAGTNTGLSIINTETGNIRNYFRKDQLPADEFNGAAAFMAGDTVYLGTVNGIVRFSIDSLDLRERAEFRTPVRITSLTTEHVDEGIRHNYSLPYALDSTLVIDPGVRYFSIAFGGLDKSVRQLEYYYRLDDQEEWHTIGQGQEITFVEMSPGSYDLQLAALLPDGQWSHSLFRMPLIVKPAFRQTIWFKVLMALGITLIIWGIFQYRENVLLKEKKLRIKIAGDLHDEVGSSLTRIYFQADTLSANPQPLPGDRQQLKKIAATSQDALLTMGDLVWSIDSRFDTMKDMVIRMKDYLYKLREELSIDFRLNIYGKYEATPLSQTVRQNLFLIFKEALTNAIKHGDGSEIVIDLDLEHSIHLEIKNGYSSAGSGENNGGGSMEGSSPEGSTIRGNSGNKRSSRIENYLGGRGLQSMQRRAASMKGRLSVSTENGIFHLKLAYRENNPA